MIGAELKKYRANTADMQKCSQTGHFLSKARSLILKHSYRKIINFFLKHRVQRNFYFPLHGCTFRYLPHRNDNLKSLGVKPVPVRSRSPAPNQCNPNPSPTGMGSDLLFILKNFCGAFENGRGRIWDCVPGWYIRWTQILVPAYIAENCSEAGGKHKRTERASLLCFF